MTDKDKVDGANGPQLDGPQGPQLDGPQDAVTESRRKFLKTAGKIAIYTPPAMMVVSQPSYATFNKTGGHSYKGGFPFSKKRGFKKHFSKKGGSKKKFSRRFGR